LFFVKNAQTVCKDFVHPSSLVCGKYPTLLTLFNCISTKSYNCAGRTLMLLKYSTRQEEIDLVLDVCQPCSRILNQLKKIKIV